MPILACRETSSDDRGSTFTAHEDFDNGGSRRTLTNLTRSCVLTIIACIYRAFHPNVYNPDASRWRRYWWRLILASYTLLTPYLIIGWAMAQWSGARHIRDTVNEIMGKRGMSLPTFSLPTDDL